MSSTPFDLAFLNDLLAQPEKAPRTAKIKDVRDNDTWFTLYHHIAGYCENEDCVAVKLGVVNQFSGERQGRNRVTATVKDHEMCRFCFLDGWHYTPQ
jgi:hypothetical protein